MRTRSGFENANENAPQKMGVSIMGTLEYAIIHSHSENKCCGNWTRLRKSRVAAASEEGHLKLAVPEVGEVSALWLRPANARWLLVLAHGAGAGMNHPFLEKLSVELAGVEVATFRYQFPYMEQRRRLPDPPSLLKSVVRAAVLTAAVTAPELPILAAGKSMGGRMTSSAAAEHPPEFEKVRGLVFFGFPLHPPGRPGTKRAEHLAQVRIPMLFLQGARDQFADLKLLCPICANLGTRATLREIATADHSFHVLKSSGKTDAEVMSELARSVRAWAESLSHTDAARARE